MYVSRLLSLQFFVLAFVAVLGYGSLNPINDIPARSELSDLNKAKEKSINAREESSSFKHYDEDSLRLVADLNQDKSFKYDVEMLESRDIKKETEELEERFRGPAIKMNTDNFVEENIEVHGGTEKDVHEDDADEADDADDDDDDDFKPNHIILTMVLVFAALFSISLYMALVIWRSHLERRYGMRELLVTDDDDFYLPSSEAFADRR